MLSSGNAVLDAKEARRLATALTAEHAREEVAWEMVGKLLCLAQAFEKTGSEAELLRQVAALQQEAAQLLCEQL